MVPMTWSLNYTQAAQGNGSVNTFYTYFFDTFLDGLTGYSVGAGGDSFERVVSITLNDIKGGTSSSYLWFNWVSGTNTAITQYENERYSSTPGDNGSLSTGNPIGAVTAPSSGSWRIWESSDRDDAFLVTKGKVGQFFWPGVGSGKWNLYHDRAWNAGDDNPNTCVGFATGGNTGVPYCNAPATNAGSSSEFMLAPNVANYGTFGETEAAFVYEGVGFNYTGAGLNSTSGTFSAVPCLPGGASDQGVYVPTDATSNFSRVSLSNAQLIQNSTNNKYYYYMSDSLASPTYVLDFGTTEPTFT